MALTDQTQTVVNKYSYLPYGEILSQQEQITQPFKFVGQYGIMQEANGFYYMRARYYDPTVGRFISEDPLGFDSGDVNLYAYVGGNPIGFVDPSGLEASSGWSKAATIADSLAGGIEAASKIERIGPGYNEGFKISNSALIPSPLKPFQGAAKFAGNSLALVTSGAEIWSIAQGEGSLGSKTARIAGAVTVNIAVYAGTAVAVDAIVVAVPTVTIAAGAGIAVTAGISAGGNYIKGKLGIQ